jgi:uridine kinase
MTGTTIANSPSPTTSRILSVSNLFCTLPLQKVYTKGRPPWYDRTGKSLKKPYLIGICGGSASGKTTVAQRIIDKLEMPCVLP